jgi:thioredoxin 1
MREDIITVTDQDFEQQVLHSDLPVLVDFWASWCGPCHMVAPVVEQIAAEQAGKLRVAKLNVDDSPQIAGRFGVMSIPTLILFQRRRGAGPGDRGPRQGTHRPDAAGRRCRVAGRRPGGADRAEAGAPFTQATLPAGCIAPGSPPG